MFVRLDKFVRLKSVDLFKIILFIVWIFIP
jgi:hypothetical protein